MPQTRQAQPKSGYFVIADWSLLATNQEIDDDSDDPPDFKFAMRLIKNYKIASTPPSAFFADNKAIAAKYVRFCFFKKDDVFEKVKSYFKKMNKK